MAEIRDNRAAGWYWIDNAILEMYGSELGAYGIAVYNALAYRANNSTQQCWPGKADIERLTGVSVKQVSRELRNLERLGLIEIERRPRKGGRWDTNLYTLLSAGGRDCQTVGSAGPQGVGSHGPHLGSASPPNKTDKQDLSTTTTNDSVCAADRETDLPEDLQEALETIGFRSREGEQRLADLYATDGAKARALVRWAAETGDNPAAFLATALAEGWEPPAAPEVLEPADPNCPICRGVGRLRGADGQWGDPCSCRTGPPRGRQ